MSANNNNNYNNNNYNNNNNKPLTMPNQRNCVCEVVDKQLLQISHKCEGHSTVFHETCAHFGIIWHLGLKNPTASP